MDSLSTIFPTAKAPSSNSMEANTSVIGNKALPQVEEYSDIVITQSTMANSSTEINTEKAKWSGKTIVTIGANGCMICLKVKVFFNGPMEGFTVVNGKME